jgi:hypothetical protein
LNGELAELIDTWDVKPIPKGKDYRAVSRHRSRAAVKACCKGPKTRADSFLKKF